MMISTTAIVLKKTDSGEHDAMVTFYTRDFGKMRARAIGIKKEAARLKGHCEPFHVSAIGFIIGKSGERLIYADVIQSWPAIRADYNRLSTALAIADHIDVECFPGQYEPELWRFLLKSFEDLETGIAADNVLKNFEEGFRNIV